jgi:hypothetical protein
LQITSYISKEVSFKFRGNDFHFGLSQCLFSSADVDSGTRFLLRILSRVLDEAAAEGKPPPRYVLDAGCGAGIIGICAAGAIMAMGGGVRVRAQDRDDLARLVTSYNAGKNRIPPSVLEARTEPLLAGPGDVRWDLILSNIPAKAGRPVLEDFVRRSAGLLNPGGRVVMAAVHTLAGFFREQIAAAGVQPAQEEQNAEYSVFVFGGNPVIHAAPVGIEPGFLEHYPFYVRATSNCKIEEIPLRLETVHGAPGFDDPGGAVLAAAKLARRIEPRKLALDGAPVLIHEPGQGFFPCWLLEYLHRAGCLPPALVLSGRNILALEAARHNVKITLKGTAAAGLTIVPAADLQCFHAGDAVQINPESNSPPEQYTPDGRFGFVAAFPEQPPRGSLSRQMDWFTELWKTVSSLLAGGGVFIAGFGSTDAERFDRKKPAGFIRFGDLKRKGFRALGYESGPPPFR